jgi:hypothetical protein
MLARFVQVTPDELAELQTDPSSIARHLPRRLGVDRRRNGSSRRFAS